MPCMHHLHKTLEVMEGFHMYKMWVLFTTNDLCAYVPLALIVLVLFSLSPTQPLSFPRSWQLLLDKVVPTPLLFPFLTSTGRLQPL